MNNQALKDARSAMNTRLFLLFLGAMLVMNSITTSARYGLSWLNIANVVTEGINNGTINPDEPMTEAAPEEEAGTAEAVTEGTTELASAELDLNELVRQMQQVGITVDDLRFLGVLSIIMAVLELICGLICIIFSNRVDRAKIVLSAVIVLIAAEVVFIVISIMKGTLMASSLIYSVIIPGILLWCALKLRKFAKENPERVFVVAPSGRPVKRGKKGPGSNSGASGSTSGASGDGAASGSSSVSAEPASAGKSAGKSLHERAMIRAEKKHEEPEIEVPEVEVPEIEGTEDEQTEQGDSSDPGSEE